MAYCARKRARMLAEQDHSAHGSAAHAMIVRPQYARLILSGRKTIEARLLKARSGPYPSAAAGDDLYIRTLGRYVAKARIAHVERFDNLTPASVTSLKLRYNDEVLGEETFWQLKSDARYAVLLWLCDVAPATRGPRVHFAPRQAWMSITQATSNPRTRSA